MKEKKPKGRVSPPQVVDLRRYQELRALGWGGKRLCDDLGIAHGTVYRIQHGDHWQQDPERVKRFNAEYGFNVDPETGYPTDEDLARQIIAGRHRQNDLQAHRDKKALVDAAAAAGFKTAGEAIANRMAAKDGFRTKLKGRPLETRELIELLSGKIELSLHYLDDETLAKSTARDLAHIATSFTEKIQLLKGEPTSIVSHETRGTINEVAKKLMQEIKRRGITVDMVQQSDGVFAEPA